MDPAGGQLGGATTRRVGPYVLRRTLGAGGMGRVWLADDPEGRPVAVKLLRPELAADPEFLDRFRREVAAARRVAGSCTARVLDADVDAPEPYLVTEFVDGPSLAQAIADSGPLPAWGLEGFAVGVAAALTAIHAAGLVHRDLKPANVLLSPYGPRVIDFGIARALDAAALTRTGRLMGTPGWMAPEQLAGGQAGPPADVFLWGCLVAFAGTGRQPFGEGTPREVAARILAAAPYLAGLPEALAAPVRAATARDPAARPSARALLLDLLGEAAPAASGDSTEAVTGVLARTWTGGRPVAGGVPGPAPRRTPPTLVDATRPVPPVPAGPTSRPQAPPRPRRRRWYQRKRFWGLTAILLLLVVPRIGDRPAADSEPPPAAAPSPEQEPEPSPAASPTSTPSPTPSPEPTEPAAPGLGTAVSDGGLQFVVSDVACGAASIGEPPFAREAQGVYCLVGLQVTNVGDEPQTLPPRQILRDTAGRQHGVDGAGIFLLREGGLWDQVNPGNTVNGRLAFDVPPDAEPAELELHGGLLSRGVRVRMAP